MLEPDYFYGKSDVLISYEQELEDWILKDIAMRLLKAGTIAGTTDMELYKLQQLGLHQNEIVKRLSSLTQKSTAEIRRLLQDAVLTSWDDDKSTLSNLGIDAVSPFENPVVMDLLDAEFKKTLGEVNNLTRSTMMQSQRDLMDMLNEAEIRVAAGVQSYNAAVCDILDRYGKSGVMVDYPTGTRRTLEAAVRMCVVTSMNQTAAQVTNHYISDHKVEYVLVSAHLGARTQRTGQPYLAGHDNWQGRVYKISGSEPDAPNLAEMTGYDIVNGTGHVINPLGLHGYNCRHSHKPWNKSLRNPYLDENGNLKIDSKENRKIYELQQQQRAIERSIRQTKRQLIVKQAEIDGVAETDVKSMLQPEYDRLAYRLRMQNQKYKEFCADHGLQSQTDRIKVAGFKRAQAAKANGRATAYQNSAKIIEKPTHLDTQEYRELELEESIGQFKRKDNVIYANRVLNYKDNEILISKNSKMKPKQLHEINITINEAKRIIGVKDSQDLPTFVILSDTELPSGVQASYRASDNIMFINEKMLSNNVLDKTVVGGSDPKYTMVHELIHWDDARKYKAKVGEISEKYLKYNISDCKKRIDRLIKNGYNVRKISDYAKAMYDIGRYDEVYTEYRTLQYLKKEIR